LATRARVAGFDADYLLLLIRRFLAAMGMRGAEMCRPR